MLNMDKKIFIYNKIFSYITEKKKLDLIIYNKIIQNFFNISLTNYKLISKKYKIGDKSGKGKEYNIKDELIFEGEYLNGKRNGYGKEYYNNGKLKYEGEYLNGKIWNGKIFANDYFAVCEIKNGEGYIYEYNNEIKLKFGGEYKNGERNGNGKEYYNDGILKFEGKYSNGEKSGKWKEFYNQNNLRILRFEGEYLAGQRNGKGKEYDYFGKLIYEGEFLNG